MKSNFNMMSLTYQVSGEIRRKLNEVDEALDDAKILRIIQNHILKSENTVTLNLSEKKILVDSVFNALRRELDFLQKYVDDPEISEIMINGKDTIFIEKKGEIIKIPEYFPSVNELEEIIMRIGARVHREINEMNPILDARLEDGSRVNAVYKNIAIDGPTMNIRKFPASRITMEELINFGSITRECAEFLKILVICGYNIFLSGGTSSGKTTFLNALSDFIPKNERVIVIEDSAELQLDKIENIVRMETKHANLQGKGEITMRNLIKSSLRMRPDRIIVGEVRGAEVVDMINSMNTGHDGSLSTGHANSAKGMLSRLETMFLTAAPFPIEAIRGQIASAIDIIVHLGRLKDKSRKVLEITEIAAFKDGEIILNPLFEYKFHNQDGKFIGELKRSKNHMVNTLKLEMRGERLNDS